MIKQITSFFQLSSLFLIILFGSCEPTEVSPWDVVDSNSVLIVELKQVPVLPEKTYNAFISNKANPYLLAIQKSSKTDYDILYSYVISNKSYDSLLSAKSISENQKKTNRKFNGIEIHELKNERNEIQLTFAFINGVFVLSKSSVLVENAVRVFQSREKKNFRVSNSELFQFPSLKSDQGDVYINADHISELFSGESILQESIPILNELQNLAVYDVKSNDGFLSLNGFSLGKDPGLALFQKQKPVTFKVAKYIPNYSKSMVHFGASDFRAFKKEIDSSFLKKIDLGNEIAFISSDNASKGIIAFVEYKSGSLENFDFITSYAETYSNYQIRSVDGDLLKKRFGKMFPRVSFGFCTVKDNYILLSQSVADLKSIIDAIESDDTWGKTLDYQKFSEMGLQESNITLIVKNPDIFTGDHRILKNYSTLIDSVGLSKIKWYSVQMSALDNHFYSSINFSLGSTDTKPIARKRDNKSSIVELQATVKFASAVKNHNTGLTEIIIQDSNNWLYLLSPSGKVIWKRQIESQIQGPMFQLDYYKNGKLQYFFISTNKLYVVDRLGRDVSGFPKALSSTIKYSGIVDYDKSKNYRFLNALSDNNVYLLDKGGKNISEWGPKQFDKEISFSPEHIKIGGKDYFIVLLVDGTVQLFNRKGERVSVFQTKNKELFSGDFYIESGMTTSETYLNYVSREGDIVKQNLKGEILSSNNLLRGRNSKFILKRLTNGDGYFIYRVDTDKIVVFDKKEQIVFEKQNNGSTNINFQALSRGGSKLIFATMDVEQKLVQLFDESGKDLFQTPLESDIAPLLVFGKSNTEFGVYCFSQNSIVFNSIQR